MSVVFDAINIGFLFQLSSHANFSGRRGESSIDLKTLLNGTGFSAGVGDVLYATGSANGGVTITPASLRSIWSLQNYADNMEVEMAAYFIRNIGTLNTLGIGFTSYYGVLNVGGLTQNGQPVVRLSPACSMSFGFGEPGGASASLINDGTGVAGIVLSGNTNYEIWIARQ